MPVKSSAARAPRQERFAGVRFKLNGDARAPSKPSRVAPPSRRIGREPRPPHFPLGSGVTVAVEESRHVIPLVRRPDELNLQAKIQKWIRLTVGLGSLWTGKGHRERMPGNQLAIHLRRRGTALQTTTIEASRYHPRISSSAFAIWAETESGLVGLGTIVASARSGFRNSQINRSLDVSPFLPSSSGPTHFIKFEDLHDDDEISPCSCPQRGSSYACPFRQCDGRIAYWIRQPPLIVPAGGEPSFAEFFRLELDRPESVLLIAEDDQGLVGYAFVRMEIASLEGSAGPVRGCMTSMWRPECGVKASAGCWSNRQKQWRVSLDPRV